MVRQIKRQNSEWGSQNTFVDHKIQNRISPWPKSAKKRGCRTGVTDGRTDGRTDRPSYRDAFLTDASKKPIQFFLNYIKWNKCRSDRHFCLDRSTQSIPFHPSGADGDNCWRRVAEDLASTCRTSYLNTAVGIGPDRFFFSDGSSEASTGDAGDDDDRNSFLRPEAVETWFYLWRFTKDVRYRIWAKDFLDAIEVSKRRIEVSKK